MTLDDKLREIKGTVMSHIFQTKADAKEWQVKVTVQLTDEAIAQIHQAFEDAGYVKVPKEVEETWREYNRMAGYITGQEFYDRFEKEFRLFSGEDGPLIEAVFEAAKRAAGLE